MVDRSYKAKLIIEGSFPGSPDIESWILDEQMWLQIKDLFACQRRHGHCYRAGYDTLERKDRE